MNDFYQVNEQFVSIQGEGMFTGIPATFIRLQGCTVGCPWCDSGPLADLPEENMYEGMLADLEAQPLGEFNWFIVNEPEKYGGMTPEDVKALKETEIRLSMEQFQKRQTNGLTRNTWAAGGKRTYVRDILQQVRTRHVVITGGEPTMYNLDRLIAPLQNDGHYVQLETSGQNSIRGILAPDWITWSPKERLQFDAPFQIKDTCREVKWVMDTGLLANPTIIFDTFLWMLEARPDTIPYFVLMPEGCPPSKPNMTATITLLISELEPWAQPYFRYGDRLQYRLGVR